MSNRAYYFVSFPAAAALDANVSDTSLLSACVTRHVLYQHGCLARRQENERKMGTGAGAGTETEIGAGTRTEAETGTGTRMEGEWGEDESYLWYPSHKEISRVEDQAMQFRAWYHVTNRSMKS